MCITHIPKLLKQWRRDNQDKDSIVAYKVIENNNESLWHEFTWSVGKHRVVVNKLDYLNNSGSGFYAFLNHNEAFDYYFDDYWEEGNKVIAVHINPKDVVYMGTDCNDTITVIVCRVLEAKSLRGLKY